MSAIVADELIGAWSRESMRIGDDKAFEDSRVIWQQTPTRYADIRVLVDERPHGSDSGEGLEAFAGRQIWQPPQLTFHHEMDYPGNYPVDLGVLSWDGDTLIEDG